MRCRVDVLHCSVSLPMLLSRALIHPVITGSFSTPEVHPRLDEPNGHRSLVIGHWTIGNPTLSKGRVGQGREDKDREDRAVPVDLSDRGTLGVYQVPRYYTKYYTKYLGIYLAAAADWGD
ncbi:hypothetical protein F5Y07DRAFT_234779 [Xylaria sp. FL0933]|nr:hypothetical protein F5Y07DRAFT_234779 [Xylaria sp. FL0933]